MPAYAAADGAIILFFQKPGKLKTRYATLSFRDAATLDDGEMWPTSFALVGWTADVEKKVVAPIGTAVS